MTQPLHVLIGSSTVENGRWWLNELARLGYEPVGKPVDTLDGLAAALDHQPWDLVLADPALPGFDIQRMLALMASHSPDAALILAPAIYDEDLAIAAIQAAAQDCVAQDRAQWLGPVVQRALRAVQERRECRRLAAALAVAEANYRAVFEQAEHAIFVTDAATELILDANPAACTLTGRSREALCAMRLTELYPPELVAPYRILFDAHVRQSDHAPLQALVRHADGHDVPVEIMPCRIEFDGRSAILSIVRDTSQHLRVSRQEAVERQAAIEATAARNRQLSALNELGLALAETLDLDQIYHTAYEHVARLVAADGFAISLYDPAARTLRATYVVSDGKPVDVSVFPPIVFTDEPIGGRARAIARKEPEVILKH
ncbi:MAG: PAS domain S-box protein, partial [Anaerolineae bacterium]|nr:PAS domain S-box protein [Anaerolineae bacterium]